MAKQATVRKPVPQGKPVAAAKPAPKGKGKASSEDESDDKGKALVIPTINPKALSLDVGVAVIRELAGADSDIEKGKALLAAGTQKRYDVQTKLTLAITKAAMNDKSIDLSAAFSDDKKRQTMLNNQLGLALGYRQVFTLPNGKQTISFVKEVHQFFPAPGEDKDSPEYKRKQTTRTNFVHRLKQCCMVSAGIIRDKTKAEADKETGILRLSGPAVQQQFGTASVLLNEKQTVKDKKGEETKLKEKPSFTAIAARAAEAAGSTIHRGSNTRGAGAGGFSAQSIDQSIATGAKAMIQVLGKLGDAELSDDTKTLLRSLVNSINEALA